MTKTLHSLIITLLVLGFIIEILLIGVISASAGIFVVILSLVYLYILAKAQMPKRSLIIAILIILAVYILARPYSHYNKDQFNINGTFEGNPHNHPIWDTGHIH